MKSEFPFVSVPNTPGHIVGTPDPGTRLYRAQLWSCQYQDWFLAIDQICQQRGVLAPVAAADFINVSRVAIHKRLKEGRLTGFMFQEVIDANSMDAGNSPKGQPVCFIPFTECLAWANEIARRVELKSGQDILDYYSNRKEVKTSDEE